MTTMTDNNILNVTYDSSLGMHRILIDKLTEYDADGNASVSKLMCTVVRYDTYTDGEVIPTPMIFNVSPYTSLVDMHTMVRVWIDCGCPSDCNAMGIPRKWTKDSLHAWVAG